MVSKKITDLGEKIVIMMEDLDTVEALGLLEVIRMTFYIGTMKKTFKKDKEKEVDI